jgi:imidazolonepropionase-like amidohydrolase
VRSLEHGNLLDEETARMIAEKGAYLVPTMTVFDVLAKEGKGSGLDAFILSKLDFVREGMFRALELAWKAGVKIGSGTDIIGPFQYLKGRELALKAQVMGPMAAIVSATRTNAELLFLDDQIGTVEAGKLADLIVVDGNPLKDMTLFEKGLQKVLLVMKEGRILKDRP